MADLENGNDDKTQSFVPITDGTIIGNYRIIEKIGAGGMGEVYLAEDTELKRNVALKFLPPHLCQDEDCRKRFKREAQAVAKLNHPNIITIHEVSEYQGRPFFAMELVEGQSLRELAKGKELSVDRIIELAIQVCDGLSAAHDKQIVHRDIKPSNIVIDSYGRPKILDFGLAAIQGSEHLTKTGSTLGTVQYMSPEQVQGEEVDHRSDLFSLGVVLFELISGRTPFEKDNEATTLKAITQGNPEPLARYKSDIPDELQRTISKLLEKDPSLRYQHADGVISDLKRLIAPTQSSMAVASAKQKSKWPLALFGFAIIATLVVAGIMYWPGDDSAHVGSSPQERKMLAVLPFENLGSPEDEYFADGITDEITSRLAKVSGLGVISRTSAIRYKDTDKSLPQIAEELGVSFILEGTIRWDKAGDTDRVRILPQLIRVSDDTHLWADTYERALTQIFSVQADIATQIANALDVELLDAERRSVTAQSTENLEAYNLYLRAMELEFQPDYSKKSYQIRLELLLQAVELDPQFALAHAALSKARSDMFNQGYDRTEHCLLEAKSAAQRALDLEPGLPEAHLAFGWYYYMGHRDYDRALEEFTIAEQVLPGDSRIMMALGVIHKRQGKFEKAIDYYTRGLELSPRDASMALEAGISHEYLDRYVEAEQYYDLTISLAPDQYAGYQFKAEVNMWYLGDLEKARETLLRVPAAEGRVLREWLDLRIFERDYEAGLAWLRTMPSETFISQDSYIPRILSEAKLYWYMGEREEALAAYDSARILLERTIEESPDDYRIHKSLGFAYAGIGDKEKAVHHGRRAVELFPVSRDALRGRELILNLASIYVAVDDYEAALNELAYLLSIPGRPSVAELRLHPDWDPLRDHPRFQALLEKYATAD